MLAPAPTLPLFPYTPLFRSPANVLGVHRRVPVGERGAPRRQGGDDPLGVLRRAGPPSSSSLEDDGGPARRRDRKSTRLNSSHRCISYAVFCLKKKQRIHLHA